MSQCHDVYEPPDEPVAPPRVPAGTQCHDRVEPARSAACTTTGPVGTELTLAGAVRDWSEQVAPGDHATAHAAVASALYCLACGASVGEAFAQARERVWSRLRHPSHRPVRSLVVAS